ncbi:MAG: hypothetical protein WBE76_00775 [Terracidiphilus sp.]
MQSEALAKSKPGAIGVSGLLNWGLMRPRRKLQFGALEGVVLALYTALLAWTVAHHVPWADEAQGWLVARDSSLAEIFTTRLHYEGSPGLWHLLLWFLCRMHVSFTAMRWITSVVPVAGIWVFLRYSPFPAILRITLPFSFYLLYQYAVISRNYIAAPLLVFIIAVLFANPARNLFSLAVVMGLLSNLCAQGMVISAGFVLMIAIRIWRQRKCEAQFLSLKRIAGASLCLCLFWAFSVWSTRPAKDSLYTPAWEVTHHVGGAGAGEANSDSARTATPRADADESGPQRNTHQVSKLRHALDRFEMDLTYGVSNSWLVSLLVWCVVLAFLIFRKNVFDIVPFILLQLLFEFVTGRPWHFGMVFLAAIAVLWIDWLPEGSSHEPLWRAILSVTLLALIIEQCLWSGRAIRTDTVRKYSGDRDAAEFLASRIAGKTVAGFQYHSVGVQPYFSSNIFANWRGGAFWNFTRKVDVDAHFAETLQMRPDYIVIGFAVRPPDSFGNLGAPEGYPETFHPKLEREIVATHEYEETHRFCGDAFSGHGYHEGLCQLILERMTR